MNEVADRRDRQRLRRFASGGVEGFGQTGPDDPAKRIIVGSCGHPCGIEHHVPHSREDAEAERDGSGLEADGLSLSLTLYGIVDNGLLYKHSKVEADGVSKKTDSFALESGISSTSRFGIKGSEDLGNGMTVSFKLENGFNADDGSFGDDRLFNRESSLTLSGDFGKLSFGRMGAIGSAAGDFDAAFAIGDAFDGGDGDVFGFATSDRYDNMVTYQTPSFSGFQATVQYSLNESSVDNTNRENSSQVNRYLGLALTAELGAFQGVLAYETQNYASFGGEAQKNTEDGQVVYLGGNYDFEVAKVFVMGQYFKGLAENPFAADAFEGAPVDCEGVKGYGAHVGTIVPVAGGDFTGGLYYVDSTAKYDADDVDGKYYGVALKYEYPLSKRTSVYGGTGWYKAKLDYSADDVYKEEGYQAYLGLTHCF